MEEHCYREELYRAREIVPKPGGQERASALHCSLNGLRL